MVIHIPSKPHKLNNPASPVQDIEAADDDYMEEIGAARPFTEPLQAALEDWKVELETGASPAKEVAHWAEAVRNMLGQKDKFPWPEHLSRYNTEKRALAASRRSRSPSMRNGSARTSSPSLRRW